MLAKEIEDVESAIEQKRHVSLSFGFDAYRKKDSLDVLAIGYKSVFDTSGGYVEAAVRIEGGARPDPVACGCVCFGCGRQLMQGMAGMPSFVRTPSPIGQKTW
jgi:hypothetical protein